MNHAALQSIAELRQTSNTAYLASINNEGYPVMRAMLVLENDSLRTQYFSTNTSSGKVGYFGQDSKASVYYCQPNDYKGLLFVGDIKVCTDQETKDFLWREGFERYYPKGVTDPDYCVLKFTARSGSYYNGPNSTTFTIDELEDASRRDLQQIIAKFAESGWELIDAPSQEWLKDHGDPGKLRAAIEQADQECGTCGCEFDPLYKRALALKEFL